MREFTSNEIQAQFEILPKELQEALSSTNINRKVIDIGQKHDLMIDQSGELIDQVGLTILGLTKSVDFVNDITARLGIDAKKAREIADDINAQVFASIRTHMMEIERRREEQSQTAFTISSLEQAGGFSVERATINQSEYGSSISQADKTKIISSLENPVPSKETIVKKAAPATETFTEPLVDQLLTSPTARPEEKTVQKITPGTPENLPTEPASLIQATSAAKAPVTPSKLPPIPPKKPGTDLYREPIN